MISKDDFTQFAKDTRLLDVDSALGEAMLLLSPKKTRKQSQTPKKKSIKKSEENKDDKVCWKMIKNSISNHILAGLPLHAGLLLF